MPSLYVKPSPLSGEITIPPSKSHTLRALLFGMMASSKTTLYHYLESADTQAMLRALQSLGSQVAVFPDRIEIEPGFKPADNIIDAGNSGLVLRLIGALAGLLPTYTLITGDPSIRHNRPVKPLLEGLKGLGAFAASSRLNDCAPLIVKGVMKAGKTSLLGTDSQPVSGLLIAAAFLDGKTEIDVTEPGEKPWIDLTLGWLDRFGVRYENHNYEKYVVHGPISYPGFEMTIPGDFSSAAYPLAAALITNSELTLHNVDMQDSQGDKKIVDILILMGANITIGDHTLTVRKGGRLRGMKIDVNDCIDAITILAVIGCFAEGTTELVGGAIARKKESDRIYAMKTELSKMGAQIEEREDGLKITASPLQGTTLHSHSDHRVAFSLAVAGIGATEGQTVIDDVKCMDKTYPMFVRDFITLGAHMEQKS